MVPHENDMARDQPLQLHEFIVFPLHKDFTNIVHSEQVSRPILHPVRLPKTRGGPYRLSCDTGCRRFVEFVVLDSNNTGLGVQQHKDPNKLRHSFSCRPAEIMFSKTSWGRSTGQTRRKGGLCPAFLHFFFGLGGAGARLLSAFSRFWRKRVSRLRIRLAFCSCLISVLSLTKIVAPASEHRSAALEDSKRLGC